MLLLILHLDADKDKESHTEPHEAITHNKQKQLRELK